MAQIDPADPRGHKAIVEAESVRIIRRRGDLIISETKHGFVCANAGVDLSNVDEGWAALLPDDSDRSARRIRDGLRAALGVEVAVIVSDTFGRPWRRGLTDVAIGCAGIRAVVDLRGTEDSRGRELQVTEVCVVDELAGAAELVMGKADGHRRRGRARRRSGVARSWRGAGRGGPPPAGGPVPVARAARRSQPRNQRERPRPTPVGEVGPGLPAEVQARPGPGRGRCAAARPDAAARGRRRR